MRALPETTTFKMLYCDIFQMLNIFVISVGQGCMKAREQFEICRQLYGKLAQLVPVGQYYRYNDHWSFLTQRLVFLIALTIFLEIGLLVERDTVAEILGCKCNSVLILILKDRNSKLKLILFFLLNLNAVKTSQKDGFHLDIEDYLMGVLQLASELSRFATNSVTLGDYERPMQISRFMADLSAGFRLLNLKNDGLRKRFDGLKYDVKKIEEIVYDISIRRLRPSDGGEAESNAPAASE